MPVEVADSPSATSEPLALRSPDDLASPYLPLSLTQYHALLDQGLLLDDASFELRRGVIVPKDRRDEGNPDMSIGPGHMSATLRFSRLATRIDERKYTLLTQAPLSLPQDGEPEPDGLILRGGVDAWDDGTRRPVPGDALCVCEISSSSLALDRGPKLVDYALDRVARYLIVNLVDHQVEVFMKPRGNGFEEMHVLHPGDTLTIPLDGDDVLTVPVADLLPQSSSR